MFVLFIRFIMLFPWTSFRNLWRPSDKNVLYINRYCNGRYLSSGHLKITATKGGPVKKGQLETLYFLDLIKPWRKTEKISWDRNDHHSFMGFHYYWHYEIFVLWTGHFRLYGTDIKWPLLIWQIKRMNRFIYQ